MHHGRNPLVLGVIEPTTLDVVTNSSALLILWDVDGTLIYNGGVSKQAYARGFEKLTGTPPTEPVITDGMTDTAIMRSLFERHGLVLGANAAERVHEVMAEALGSLVPQLTERGHAMPGAREAIDALSKVPDVVQSVLTGNIAPNARQGGRFRPAPEAGLRGGRVRLG